MMEYTLDFNIVLKYAEQEAQRLGNSQIQSDHIILGMLRLGVGNAYDMLVRSGVDIELFKRAIDQQLQQPQALSGHVPMSRSAQRQIRLATVEANNQNAEITDTQHLLLSILRERVNFPAMWLKEKYNVTYETIETMCEMPKQAEKHSPNVLGNDFMKFANNLFGKMITVKIGSGRLPDEIAKEIAQQLPIEQPQEDNDEEKSEDSILLKYGTDLTEKARQGKITAAVGRQSEMQRIVQILARKKKNNPVLIGDPGVGKTAIVEGLAVKIANNQIHALRNKRIIALNMASIVAGTSYRGQFEQRMQQILQELYKHPEVILFMDEIHTIIGAGNAHGSLDAANILKPALARGEIQCIGATTTEEYRKTIEKDGALERRFQSILVRPTTAEETTTILLRIQSQYEDYHQVFYSPAAIQACVSLSQRYLTNRAFPDKAIDVLDEAGAAGGIKRKKKSEVIMIYEADIAAIVARMSGVPIEKISQKESDNLRGLESRLQKEVIGQDEAIRKTVRAIQRSRLGLKDPNRPIGTFFFLGSTGVGKTYLAQCLAEQLFGTKDAMIRFDMSEFSEKHTVSLLVGAPPGYEAHEEGGKLTEAVRNKPYSIVLFDEIEKAHPDIFQILLQLLDEGRLTDRQGRQTDFRNTIIILTSNVGTRQLRDFGMGVGFDTQSATRERTAQMLQKTLEKAFPPEFVNRIDDVIIFDQLSKDNLEKIVDLELTKLKNRLKNIPCTLTLSKEAKQQLIDAAFDPKNGARPVKRAIQTYIEDVITDQLLENPNTHTVKINSLHVQ